MGTRLLLGSPFVAAAGIAVATACGSFSGADPGADDGGVSEAATQADVAVPETGAPDSPETADAAACLLSSLPTLVATTTSGPVTKLLTNGESFFWIEGGTRIVRAKVADCSTTQVVTGNINALGVDSNWIVWGDDTYNVLAKGDVGKPPTTHPAQLTPSLILAGGGAYWLSPAHDSVAACESPCVNTTTAALADSTTLLTANASRFFVFATDADSGAGGSLFWQALSGDPLHGPIVTGQNPVLLAANDLQVFWVNADGAVYGMPSGGGTKTPFDPVVGAVAIAVDNAFVYVATSKLIERAPVAGGDWAPIGGNETAITSLLLTNDAVVWGTQTQVRRMKKN